MIAQEAQPSDEMQRLADSVRLAGRLAGRMYQQIGEAVEGIEDPETRDSITRLFLNYYRDPEPDTSEQAPHYLGAFTR